MFHALLLTFFSGLANLGDRMSTNTFQNVPDNVMMLLAQADEQQGFPPGTMAAVMQREIGGQYDKYLSDPTQYHYAPNAQGKRIAGHTGKISTAFGPFGILESTAKQPGFGVTPLQDKSLEEQVRFAAEYLGARSARSGGLPEGLAAYGEGEAYAQKVAQNIPGVGSPVAAAAGLSPKQSDDLTHTMGTLQDDIETAQLGTEVKPGDPAWAQLEQVMAQAKPTNASKVAAQGLNYGQGKSVDFGGMVQQGLASLGNRAKEVALTTLTGFQGWGR